LRAETGGLAPTTGMAYERPKASAVACNCRRDCGLTTADEVIE
jgi:hypothetical protein